MYRLKSIHLKVASKHFKFFYSYYKTFYKLPLTLHPPSIIHFQLSCLLGTFTYKSTLFKSLTLIKKKSCKSYTTF